MRGSQCHWQSEQCKWNGWTSGTVKKKESMDCLHSCSLDVEARRGPKGQLHPTHWDYIPAGLRISSLVEVPEWSCGAGMENGGPGQKTNLQPCHLP